MARRGSCDGPGLRLAGPPAAAFELPKANFNLNFQVYYILTRCEVFSRVRVHRNDRDWALVNVTAL